MMNSIRFGLIGAGAIAGTYVRAMERVWGAEFVGVADANPHAAQEMARAMRVPWATSFDELHRMLSLDAIIICTPPDTHAEITIAAARAGIHVLCEKPLALDVMTACAMYRAAREAGVLLTMATKFRYVDDLARARNMVRLGVLGDIVVVANEFRSVVDMRDRWNSNPLRSGGGVLIDNGTHSVDILRYLLGPIECISAEEVSRPNDLAVEESVRVFARASTGAYATLDLSWSAPPSTPYYVQIVGTRGRISVGWRESLYRGDGDETWRQFGTGYDKLAAFIGQLEDFVSGIRTGSKVQVGRDAALASVATIEAAYASMADDCWITVDGSPYERAFAPRAADTVAIA
jgi:predicted dehydrogenase